MSDDNTAQIDLSCGIYIYRGQAYLHNLHTPGPVRFFDVIPNIRFLRVYMNSENWNLNCILADIVICDNYRPSMLQSYVYIRRRCVLFFRNL